MTVYHCDLVYSFVEFEREASSDWSRITSFTLSERNSHQNVLLLLVTQFHKLRIGLKTEGTFTSSSRRLHKD